MQNFGFRSVDRQMLAKIVADVTGDGHLQLKNWRGLVSFYSNDHNKIEDIIERFRTLFGVIGRVYMKHGKNLQYRVFFISKPVARYLMSMGVPEGNKTDQSFLIPSWIMKGDRKVRAAFLRGIFSAEGSVFYTKQKNGKKRWQIGIEMYKWVRLEANGKEFMEQLRDLLDDFNIRTSPVRFGRKNLRKNGTYSVAVKMDIELNEFGKFYKEIGFDDTKKTQRLLEAIAEAQATCAEVSSNRDSKPKRLRGAAANQG